MLPFFSVQAIPAASVCTAYNGNCCAQTLNVSNVIKIRIIFFIFNSV